MTAQDPILKRVSRYIEFGWPEAVKNVEQDLKPYFVRKFALIKQEGVIMYQANSSRVVIPLALQERVFSLLHVGHWGVVRTKQLARLHCWWPTMDQHIEQNISRCIACQSNSSSPRQEFVSWPIPHSAWSRIHVDFAGPFLNRMYFICVDALSNYPYVVEMGSTTSEATIRALQNIFAIEGLPETLVSDNGSQFSSAMFKDFCNEFGITHITTAPFHPASNGEAERMVRTFKTAIQKQCSAGLNERDALLTFLSSYRSTPNNTGKSPAELLHGRAMRTLLSTLKPSLSRPKSLEPISSKFQQNQQVFIRNYARGSKWIPGVVQARIGRKMYRIETRKGNTRRHQNQIRAMLSSNEFETGRRLLGNTLKPNNTSDLTKESQPSTNNQHHQSAPEPRRSARTSKPVVRFQSDVNIRNRRKR